MTLTERRDAYARSPEGIKYPDSVPRVNGRWLEAHWIMGNDYRASAPLYGAYPPRYLTRVLALFPDARRILHAFAGCVAPGPWLRVDISHARRPAPDLVADVTALPLADGIFDLVLADPPYSREDAARYGTSMVNRPKALRELARVTRPGGTLVWLDTQVPMFAKRDWHWWGAVTIIRSTNHRVREATFFERTIP